MCNKTPQSTVKIISTYFPQNSASWIGLSRNGSPLFLWLWLGQFDGRRVYFCGRGAYVGFNWNSERFTGGFSISLLMGLFTGYVGCFLRASVPRQQGTIAWPSLDLVLGTTRYHFCHTVWVKAVTVVTKVPGQQRTHFLKGKNKCS